MLLTPMLTSFQYIMWRHGAQWNFEILRLHVVAENDMWNFFHQFVKQFCTLNLFHNYVNFTLIAFFTLLHYHKVLLKYLLYFYVCYSCLQPYRRISFVYVFIYCTHAPISFMQKTRNRNHNKGGKEWNLACTFQKFWEKRMLIVFFLSKNYKKKSLKIY